MLIFGSGCAGEKTQKNTATASSTQATAYLSAKTADSTAEKRVQNTEKQKLNVQIGNRSFWVMLEKNESTQALIAMLQGNKLTVSAENHGSFEKILHLAKSLPRKDIQITARAGEVMLYNGNQIVIFYAENSWFYTRLGRVDNLAAEELKGILNAGDREAILSIK